MRRKNLYESPEMRVIRLEEKEDVIRTSTPVTDNDVYEDDFFE